ncbi:MAG: hypothetical protein KFB95_07740 [Simkaniaceae bacterium]|nr:MAG: hypothetical protein KFB95_07740 [Simkaniaceae bacterium]
MEAIIDGIEALVFGNPCEGDKRVDETHRIIATNIDGEDIDSRIQKAQVIILLEQRNKEGNNCQETKHLNGRIIRHDFNKGDHLLSKEVLKLLGSVEKDVDLGYLPYSIRRHSQSLDTQTLSKDEIKVIQHWQQIIDQTLTACAMRFLSTQFFRNIFVRYPNDSQNLLQLLYTDDWESHYDSIKLLNKQDEVEYLNEFIKKLIAELKQCEETMMSFSHQKSLPGNTELVDRIFSSLEKAQKVWVVADESRGRYTHPLNEKAVTHLYESLESQNINYITLKALTSSNKDLAFSHDKTLISQIETEETESFEKTRESLRKEFEFTYPDGTSLQEQYTHTTEVFRSLEKTIKTIDDYQEGLALKGFYAQLSLEKALEWN